MIKYLATGQEVVVVQKLDGGYLVNCLYECGCDDDYEDHDSPRIVAEVFNAPPRAKFDTQIAQLKAKCEALEARHSSLAQQVRQSEEKEKSILATLKRVKCLARLEDFINGKITHYAVIPSWGMPHILAVTDTQAEYSRNKFKLLQLFGDTGGNLEWNLNRYADGSGGNQTVIPTTSYEEAEQAIRAHVAERALFTEDQPREDVIQAAQKFNVAIDPKYIAAFNAKQVEIERANLAQHEAAAAKIKTRIEELSRESTRIEGS